MKKILTIVTLLSATVLSFGQGEMNFANGSTTRVSTNSVLNGPTTGQQSAVVGDYYYALFVAAPTVTTVAGATAAFSGKGNGTYVWNDSNWTFNNNNYGTNSLLGRFNGNYSAAGGVIINGFPSLSSASFVVIGWSANIGTTLASVMAWYASPDRVGWIGQSAVGANLGVGGGAVAPASIFGVGAPNIPGFVLGIVPVPEPATFTLAGLGAAAMLIFRRRK